MAATSSTSNSEPASAENAEAEAAAVAEIGQASPGHAGRSPVDPDAPPAHGPRPQPRMGFPWALVLAIGLLAAFELFLRTVPRMSLIAYASDEGQYHAVRDTVEAVGPAEVALVGSSQMREGVSMPVFLAELEKRLGRPVRASNYAVRGSRLDGMAAITQFLQRQPVPPKLIVVGVSQRDFRADEPDWPRVALFWTWREYGRAVHRYGWPALDVLPVMIRNQVGRVLYTLRYREQLALSVEKPLEAVGVETRDEGNPILGQLTDQHSGPRGLRNLAAIPIFITRKNFDRAKETYLFDQSPKPRPAMRASFADLVASLAAGPSKGLFVQMPVAQFLGQELEKSGQTKAFIKAVDAAAAESHIPFLPADQQSFKPTNEHFVDLQHLNRPGAELFAAWLADQVVAQPSLAK